MTNDPKDVVGIGNAIVDVLAHADEAFLEDHELAKGSMTLVEADRADELYRLLDRPVERSGGSAANSMVGVASFGGSSAYVGKVRDDHLGSVFVRDIRDAGCAFDNRPAAAGPGTGRCLVLVTPDAERTMQTYLGASATLAPGDVDEAMIRSARITYLEGYLWDPAPAKEAFLKAASLAHAAGATVALSLSDAFCVERHRADFRDLVKNHVDLLFANESEIISLYESDDFDAAVESLRGECEVAALTRGATGSVIVAGDRIVHVDPEPVAKVVDTTGAGDLYAAGFLFGMSRGSDLAACGRLGSVAAAEIIGHFGARPERPLKSLAARVIG